MSITTRVVGTFALLFSLFASEHSKATIQNFKFGENEFSVEIPKGWVDVKETEKTPGMRGVPLTIFGPENAEKSRTVILITPLDIVDKVDFFKQADKDTTPYKEAMEEWLTSRGGKLKSIDDLKTKKDWNNIAEAYFLGSRYEMNNNQFRQRTVYVVCKNKRVFHIKSLVLKKYENAHEDMINDTINSFSCPKFDEKGANI